MGGCQSLCKPKALKTTQNQNKNAQEGRQSQKVNLEDQKAKVSENEEQLISEQKNVAKEEEDLQASIELKDELAQSPNMNSCTLQTRDSMNYSQSSLCRISKNGNLQQSIVKITLREIIPHMKPIEEKVQCFNQSGVFVNQGQASGGTQQPQAKLGF